MAEPSVQSCYATQVPSPLTDYDWLRPATNCNHTYQEEGASLTQSNKHPLALNPQTFASGTCALCTGTGYPGVTGT